MYEQVKKFYIYVCVEAGILVPTQTPPGQQQSNILLTNTKKTVLESFIYPNNFRGFGNNLLVTQVRQQVWHSTDLQIKDLGGHWKAFFLGNFSISWSRWVQGKNPWESIKTLLKV